LAEVEERADVGVGAPAFRVAPSIARYEFAARWVRAGANVLDFACGTGYGVARLGAGANAVGLDNAVDALTQAGRRYRAAGTSFAAGDATAFPFAPATFDLVVCMETIEHVDDVDALLAEIKRVVRKEGVVLFSTPNKLLHSPNSEKPLNPFHVVEYTIDQFRDVLEPHFIIHEMYGQQPQDPARSAALRWAPTGALRKFAVNLPFVSAVFSKGASRFVTEGLERCRFLFAVCRPKPGRNS
jgi:SAM-dependent methyltransferase